MPDTDAHDVGDDSFEGTDEGLSRPLLHQERMVMSDLAAPTAKWAISEMMAATIIAGSPAMKKNGNTGMKAPMAVESAPEVAETQGLLRPSSLMFRRSGARAATSWSFFSAIRDTNRSASSAESPRPW